MIYLKIKAGVWVRYDEGSETGTILFRRKLVEQKQELKARINELPTYPTNAELLAWAKANYPAPDTSAEYTTLTAKLNAIQADLDNMVNE